MENFEYDYDSIKLDIQYETEDADPSVGLFSTQVFILGICHKGEDITDLIGKSTYEFLENEIYEALNGWYSKGRVFGRLFLCHPTNGVGCAYRWLMRDLLIGFLVAIGIYILFFGAIYLMDGNAI